ncbi:MAG: hypothetical protein JWM48_561 [Mycobacterium sp.]|jgi:hypothetical protein|nr:hypothetical protein [Mycobacterium sp.]MCW2744011.1 hypothetical protein [Mycobacterium sp.]
MRILGMIVTSAAGLAVLFGVYVGVRSVPDVRRYLRIRSM